MDRKKALTAVALAVVLMAALAPAREAGAHSRFYFGTGVHFGPYWYDPWYDPFYYPYYYGPYIPPNYGYLKTKVKPEQAEVWVDGKFFGIVEEFDNVFQSLKLPLGVHTAKFRLPGYRTYSVSFTITPGDTTKIKQELLPAQPGQEEEYYGTLAVSVSPPGAKIYVDGLIAATPEDETLATNIVLPPGRHDVKVSKEGYRDYNAQAMIPMDETVNMVVRLKEDGE